MALKLQFEKDILVTGDGKTRTIYRAYYILPSGAKKYIDNQRHNRSYFDQDEYDELINTYGKTPETAETKKPTTTASASGTTPVTQSTSTTSTPAPSGAKTSGTTTTTTSGTTSATTATPRVKKQNPYQKTNWDNIRKGWNWRNDLENMKTTIGSDIELTRALKDQTIKRLKESDHPAAKAALKKIKENPDGADLELFNNFYEFQNQVYTVAENIDDFSKFDLEGKWDKDRNEYLKAARDYKFKALDQDETALAQAYYWALSDLKNDSRFSETLENYVLEQHGVDDESTGKISGIDGWMGNTTIGQGILKMPVGAPAEKKKTNQIDDITPNYSLEDGYAVKKKSPFWQQDMIALGRDFGNLMSINKYLPWMNKPEFFEADPTFYDPNRALAANAEQAAIASDAIAMYAGPQQTSARIAGTQREASKNAANIISEYDKRNVDVANRFEMFNAQGRNQAARVNSNIDNELYKGWVIANQQYDNSKRAMKNNLINTYINAVTNRAYTSNLNELFPQYSIDPASGGFLNFTPDTSKIQPSQGKNAIQDVINLKQTYPDIDINKLAELYLLAQKDLTESNEDPGVKAMKAMFGTKG